MLPRSPTNYYTIENTSHIDRPIWLRISNAERRMPLLIESIAGQPAPAHRVNRWPTSTWQPSNRGECLRTATSDIADRGCVKRPLQHYRSNAKHQQSLQLRDAPFRTTPIRNAHYRDLSFASDADNQGLEISYAESGGQKESQRRVIASHLKRNTNLQRHTKRRRRQQHPAKP